MTRVTLLLSCLLLACDEPGSAAAPPPPSSRFEAVAAKQGGDQLKEFCDVLFYYVTDLIEGLTGRQPWQSARGVPLKERLANAIDNVDTLLAGDAIADRYTLRATS